MPVLFEFSVEEEPTVEPLQLGNSQTNTLRVTLSEQVIVDAVYRSPDSYSVSIVEGEGPVSVRRVLVPRSDVLAINEIVLVLDKPTEGTHYRVSVLGLNGRDGAKVGGVGEFIASRTKVGNMIRAMPLHFDRRPESVIVAILTAIGQSDETIGGDQRTLPTQVESGD